MATFLALVLLCSLLLLAAPRRFETVEMGLRLALSGVIGTLLHGGYVQPTYDACLWALGIAAIWTWLEKGPYPGFCFRPVEVAFFDPDQRSPYKGSAWARERWFGRWREIPVICDERLTRSTRVRIVGIHFTWGEGIQYKIRRL